MKNLDNRRYNVERNLFDCHLHVSSKFLQFIELFIQARFNSKNFKHVQTNGSFTSSFKITITIRDGKSDIQYYLLKKEFKL